MYSVRGTDFMTDFMTDFITFESLRKDHLRIDYRDGICNEVTHR